MGSLNLKWCSKFYRVGKCDLAKLPVFYRTVSTAETLEPIKMSYATYESAADPSQVPPLIIMHGLFGSKSNWNSLCKVYSQKTLPQRKIIAVDARNHGDSAHSDDHTYAHLAADIRALYDQLGIKKAALMGHSMGGRAFMLFALKYPELVDRLIVGDISPCSTSPNLDSMPGIFRALETIDLPTKIPMSQARAQIDVQLAKSISDKGLRAFLLTNLVQKDHNSYDWRINIAGLLANFNNVTRFPLVNDLMFNGPVLFVAGANSDYVHYGWNFNYKSLAKNVKFLISFPDTQKITFEQRVLFIKGGDSNFILFSWTFNMPILRENVLHPFPRAQYVPYNGPVVFIGGQKSDMLSKEDLPSIRELFPKAELRYIAGAGHWLHSEKPAEFLEITLDFLNKNISQEL